MLWLRCSEEDSASYNSTGVGFLFGKHSLTSLAATGQIKPSRTFKWVWSSNYRVVLLCVLRRSRSSQMWRLCRVSEGLSVDYG
ncbi:hypothetical protein AKJ16_DCAP07814 [Drosera capensis]